MADSGTTRQPDIGHTALKVLAWAITTVIAVAGVIVASLSLCQSGEANRLAKQNMVPQVTAHSAGVSAAGLAPAGTMPSSATPFWQYECDIQFTIDNIGRGDASIDSYDIALSGFPPVTPKIHVGALSGAGPVAPPTIPFVFNTLTSLQFAVLKAPLTNSSSPQLLGAPEDHMTLPIPLKSQSSSGITLRTVFQTTVDPLTLRKSTETGANPGDIQFSVAFIPISHQDRHAHGSLPVPCFTLVEQPAGR